MTTPTTTTHFLGTLVPHLYGEQHKPVRTVTDDQGSPWFVANDVCSILGLKNPVLSTRRLDDDEYKTATVETRGGEQTMLVISEPGIFHLLLTSRLTEAAKLRRFVAHEILPAIRKHGEYRTDTRWREVYGIYLDTRASVHKIQDLAAMLPSSNTRADILSAADDLDHTLGNQGIRTSVPFHVREEMDSERAYNQRREIQLRNLPPDKVIPPLPPRPDTPPIPEVE